MVVRIPSPEMNVRGGLSSPEEYKSMSEVEEEVVSIRRLPDGEEFIREVRISCPDATGLGCDISRMLLDFGLRILQGDVSTDGKWAFMVFKVMIVPGVPAHWKLLKLRLEKICPSTIGGASILWRWRSSPKDFQNPFLLQVSAYDRVGVLHDLMHTLWEADASVFKAHITTSPAAEVLDMFWLYDNRGELPDNHRVLEISDLVRQVLGDSRANCTITPAPPDSITDDSSTSYIQQEEERHGKENGGGRIISNEYGDLEDVQVTIDNCTTPAYSLVNVVCRDRKGLVYDLMRTLKDIQVRVAYGKVAVREDGTCEADLFLQEVDGLRISDPELQEELVERIRLAVALPLRISIKDVYDETCTELLITAQLDSGGRGRPRVTYDVTRALNSMAICVFMADIYVEPAEELAGAERRPQELHRFLIHFRDGGRLATPAQKRAVYQRVRDQLLGTNVDIRKVLLPHVPPPAAPAHSIMATLANWKWSA